MIEAVRAIVDDGAATRPDGKPRRVRSNRRREQARHRAGGQAPGALTDGIEGSGRRPSGEPSVLPNRRSGRNAAPGCTAAYAMCSTSTARCSDEIRDPVGAGASTVSGCGDYYERPYADMFRHLLATGATWMLVAPRLRLSELGDLEVFYSISGAAKPTRARLQGDDADLLDDQ